MFTRSIRELMKGQRIATIAAGATLREASDLMEARAQTAIVVMEDGQLKGVISESDILRHVSQFGGFSSTKVEFVMTRDVEVIETRGSIVDAVVKMETGGFQHLPVIDMGQKVIGMLTMDDIPVEYRMMRDSYVSWRDHKAAA